MQIVKRKRILSVVMGCILWMSAAIGGMQGVSAAETGSKGGSQYEAENAKTIHSDCKVATNNKGYTGTGFIDYGGKGTFVEWDNINVPSEGIYTLTIRYANGGTINRNIEVKVNGNVVESSLALLPFGKWDIWKTASVTAKLNAGNNKVTLTAADQNGPNIDNMVVTRGEAQPATNSETKVETPASKDTKPDVTTVLKDGSVQYEAENAKTIHSSCKVATNNKGYTGTGFVDYGGKGTFVEWDNINVPSEGIYTLTIRYANGGTINRNIEVKVNGNVVESSLALLPFGKWDIWKTASVTAKLNAGNNKVTITAADANGPNIDNMIVTSSSGIMSPLTTPVPTTTPDPVVVTPKSFADVVSHWAKSDVEYMASRGIIQGISDTEFAPDINITRVEFACIVVRLLEQQPTAYKGAYSDIKADQWYANFMQTASNIGLIDDGMLQNGAFLPEAQITREEMTSMIVRAFEWKVGVSAPQSDIDRFADKGEISEWAVRYVSGAYGLGIINGLSNTEFGPKNNATRAEAAAMARRLMSKL